MAPPTANDPWLAGRHFGIVIDAGSSGSRLQIYSWRDPSSIRLDKSSSLAYTLPIVDKGTKNSDGWVKKVEPGLSSLASNPTSVGTYLKPLITHALNEIPPSLHSSTPIFLMATAGMRLLSPEEQASVLSHTCQFLRTSTNFKIDKPSKTLGPCGSSVRIITGEEEGLFGWIAVNYLMDGFIGKAQDKGKGKGKEVVTYPRTTYGFLDMGGASTQIAFEPSEEHVESVKGKGLMEVRLRLLGGEEIKHRVFVTTWLGYGTNQARERYVGEAVKEFEKTRVGDKTENDIVPDPCLPRGLKLTEKPVHIGSHVGTHEKKAHTLQGTGSFEQCMRKTESLLNKDKPCPNTTCLMNGIYVPPINFSASHFIGISEYWYSSEHVFNLGGPYDFVQYERAASEFCGRDWQSLLDQHEDSRKKHHLGGDGEVIKNGTIVETGIWGPQVELPRLQMQCFKAAWIVNVLHEGLGMPRIVDPEGNNTTSGEIVADKAGKKGLGRPPTFQSVDTVGDIAISWTLGKMVLEASKEVPFKRGDRPLVDPIDDIDNNYDDSPVKPIRPPFFSSLDAMEDSLTPHLPTSLTRASLGFSPILLFFCVLVFFLLFLIAYPLRRQLRTRCLRLLRPKRDIYGDLLEEGRMNGSGGGNSNSGTSSLIFGSTKKTNTSYSLSQMPRSSPMPAYSNGGSINDGTTVISSTQYNISRAGSPAPGIDRDDRSMLTSRSRNTSQANLSTLARPSGTTSRVNSSLFSRK